MYIPLLDSLQSILKSDTTISEEDTLFATSNKVFCFVHQIFNGHKDEVKLNDFCDGEVYRTHPLFSVHSTAFQLFFYFDDLEVCNPLGSKSKIHKLSKCLDSSNGFIVEFMGKRLII